MLLENNPNLVSLALTKEDKELISKVLQALADDRHFTDDEELYLVAPVLAAMSEDEPKLLRSLVDFLLKVIQKDDIQNKLKQALLN